MDDLCTDDSGYDTARETACRNNPEDSRCPDTITRLCDADALDDLCTNDSGYDTARETACRNNVCTDNPFDPIP